MSLFVGNISRNVSTHELEDAFLKYGQCEVNHKVRTLHSHVSNRAAMHLRNIRM